MEREREREREKERRLKNVYATGYKERNKRYCGPFYVVICMQFDSSRDIKVAYAILSRSMNKPRDIIVQSAAIICSDNRDGASSIFPSFRRRASTINY